MNEAPIAVYHALNYHNRMVHTIRSFTTASTNPIYRHLIAYKGLLLIFLGFGTPIFAQHATWPMGDALDSLLFSNGRHSDAPGWAVCVVQDGRVVYERQMGMANIQRNIPITAETMFNFGSVSKQFTAACILLLEEAGKLNRSDDIRKYIPEIPTFEGHTVTLNHLLGHTSGINDHLEVLILQNKYNRKRICTEQTMFKYLRRRLPLAFPPGTDHAYSNTGYMLLNMVVERVSGMPMKTFAEQHLFKPLGMAHSSYQYDEAAALTDGTASYHFQDAQNRYKAVKRDFNAMGATGVHGTLRDLALWDQNFHHNRLGKGRSDWPKQMETPYRLVNGASTHYGMGLFIRKYRGIPSIDHGGGWNGFLLQHRRFPTLGITVIVASNNDHTRPFALCDKICDRLLTFKPLVGDFDTNLRDLPISVEPLQGTYLSSNNRIRHVRVESDTLKIGPPGGGKAQTLSLAFLPAVSTKAALFFLDERGDTLQFQIGDNQTPTRILWEGGDYFRCRRAYEKLGVLPQQVSPQWAGKYRSPEMGQTVRIKYHRRTGQLRLYPVFFKRYDLIPLSEDVFSVKGEDLLVRFTHQSIILGHYWLQNLRLGKE